MTTPTTAQRARDHLGNVRLTFTAKDELETGTATLEDENAAEESGDFLYYDEAVKVKSKLFDHTNNSLEYNPEPCSGCPPDPGPPGAEELGNGYATRLTEEAPTLCMGWPNR